ncbi:MAG: hypothetical protein R3C53_06355 [Pirellulaceae bacterium]
MNYLQLTLGSSLFTLCCVVAQAQEFNAPAPIALGYQWEIDPDLNASWSLPFPDLDRSVDLQRLTSPVLEYRLQEARHVMENAEFLDATEQAEARQALLAALRNGASNRMVRLAQASAWCKLYDADSAHELWDSCQKDSTVRDFVEQVLITQRSDLALSTWLSRLVDAQADPRQQLTAIDGVAACQAKSAIDPLTDLLRNEQTNFPVKLAAARALGILADAGLEELASQWLDSNRTLKEQVAANLLANHDTPGAEAMMDRIVKGSFAPAQVVAYRWFATWRPTVAQEMAAQMIKHADSSLRLLAARVLQQVDDADSLRMQANLLSDRNLTVRRTIRNHLIAKAENADLRPVVDELVAAHLRGEAFEGIEQAMLVAAGLNDKSHCPQLVALLEHPRPEVHVRAAWALEQLVDDPELLSQILKHCVQWTDWLANDNAAHPVEDTDLFRMAHLFGALGRNAYQPADEMLRLYVPKNTQKMRPTTRIPAIWALGLIWKGNQETGLERELIARIMDMSTTDPEEDTVRYACALTLGRLGNKSSIEALENTHFKAPDPVGVAIDWALQQLRN